MATSTNDRIHRHFSTFPKRTYPKGQILIFADENPEHIFYIVKGKVRQYDVSYRGDEVILTIFKPPAFFPMSWAINHTPNKFFFKTEEATELHVVPASDALDFLRNNPDIMLDLLGRVYRGMDGLLGRVVQLMAGTAQTRLVYELLIECRRFGEKQPDGSYVLTANELDFAGRAGLSRETINRELKKLKNKGYLSVGSGAITIKELNSLEKLLS